MSLHTKYRPSTFEEVLGQDAVVHSLKGVVRDARAHCFIFTGPSGTGKTTLARIVASQFIGSDANVGNLQEIDAASRSGADDVRNLVNGALYRSIGGSPTKFFIIDEAHRLSAAAWTVLLKPVEEPPPHVYYAFCTTDVAKIPKAILTRCLKYDLKPVKEELILELLIKVADTDKLDVSDDIIEAIAENAGGSPRQALVYLEACLSCRSLADAREIMRATGQSKEVIDLARWLLSGKAQTWPEARKYLKGLEGQESESCRIVLTAYFTTVLLGANSDKAASNVLRLLDCFSTPYNTSDKLAPLLLSVGLALGLDR